MTKNEAKNEIVPFTLSAKDILLSADSLFLQPNYLVGGEFHVNIPFLFWLVENSKPSTAVCIGLEDPIAYFSLCQVLNFTAQKCASFAITDDSLVGTNNTTDTKKRLGYIDYNKKYYSGSSKILQTPIKNAGDLLNGTKIDLLLINQKISSSDWKQIKSVFLPLLSEKAVVFFCSTVDDATITKDLKKLSQNRKFALDTANGASLYCLGANTTMAIANLCNQKYGTRSYFDLQEILIFLGSKHTQDFHNLQSKKTISALKRARDERLGEFAETKAKLAALEVEMQETSKIVDSQSMIIAEFKTNNFLKRDEVQDLKNSLILSENSLTDVSKQLSLAQNQLAERLIDLATLGDILRQTQNELDQLKKRSQQKQTDLSIIEQKYRDRIIDLATLGQVLDKKENAIKNLVREQHQRNARTNLRESLIGLNIRTLLDLSRSKYSIKYHKARRRLNQNMAALSASGIFDRDWYLKQYPDVTIAGLDPLKHFIMHGAFELRNPGPNFNSEEYHIDNPDVIANNLVAAVHYSIFGKTEGRRVHKV